jgi:virulence-associated protein VagC
MEIKDIPFFIEKKFGAGSVRITQQNDSLVLEPVATPAARHKCPFLGILKHQKGMSEEQIAERRAGERG